MRFDHALVLACLLTSKYAHGSVEEQLITFSDNLAAEMYSEDTNDCTSSLGISMAFDLLYSGATGDSKTEMESVFGFSEPKLQWADNEISTLYNGDCYDDACEYQDPLVRIANRIWANSNVALNATYQAVVQDYVQAVDFNDETTIDTINEWASNATNGLIEYIVEDVDPAWIILAVNAIYLKAGWRLPFLDYQTTLDSFAGTDAHFMHKVEYLPYSDTAVPNYQIVKMEFFGGSETTQGLSMVVAAHLADGVTPSLTAAEVVAAMPQLTSTRVALALPKFKYETTYDRDLKAALQNLGLPAPFSGGLCIQQGSCDAFINFIIQKTVIDVNEEGVEAAAVTAIGVVESVPLPTSPALMQLDTPFQFWILHNELPLFEGRVINPGIPEGSTAASGLSHADADFWTNNFMVDEPYVVEPQQDGATRGPSPSPAAAGSDIPTPLSSDPVSDVPTGTPTSPVATTPSSPTNAPITSPSDQNESGTEKPSVRRIDASINPTEAPNTVPVAPVSSSGLQQVLNSFVIALGFILTAL